MSPQCDLDLKGPRKAVFFLVQRNVENRPNYENLVQNMSFKSQNVTAMKISMFTEKKCMPNFVCMFCSRISREIRDVGLWRQPQELREWRMSANKEKTESLTWMPTAGKAVKKRNCTQMPVTKKEKTDHKYLWQRKKEQTINGGGKRKNGCPNQESTQLTPNERNKTAEPNTKTQTVAYLQA